MQHPFTVLAPEYTRDLSRMKITRLAEIDMVVIGTGPRKGRGLLDFIDAGRYKAGCDATGVPQPWAAPSFEREASSNFSKNPAQGAPLNQRSTIIPYNGPFPDWKSAQIAAYQIDGLDKVGAKNWTWEAACYYAEAFNGFGPRNHGRHSGYLWAGSNVYDGGKYVRDGVWDPNANDQQLGVIPMMVRIVQLRPALALPHPFPTAIPVVDAPSIVPPQAPPIGVHSAKELQEALNKLGADPLLVVDGSYGRRTRYAVMAFQKANGLAADGLAGPKTWAALSAKLPASAQAEISGWQQAWDKISSFIGEIT